MMAEFTNTKESGLETLIVNYFKEHNGYEEGTNGDYNEEYAVDETRLFRFLKDTQKAQMEKLGVFKSDQKRRQFLNRLSGELLKRGVVDVLRNGIKSILPTSSCFMPHPRRAMKRPKRCTGRISSALPVSFAIPLLLTNWPWICAFLSTVCLSSPLS